MGEQTTRAGSRLLGSRRPAVLLGVVQLMIAVSVLLWDVATPYPVLQGNWNLAATLLMAGLCAAGFLLPARFGNWWWPLSAFTTLALICLGSLTRVTPQGFMTTSVLILALVTSMAALLPFKRYLFWLAMGTAAVAFTNTFGNADVDWLYPMVLILAMTGISLLVNFLVRELERLVREAKEASLKDPLTGLVNRRGFTVAAQTAHSISSRAGTPTTVAMIDLDGFKKVNDQQGHKAGDILLVDLAHAWGAALRTGDILGRVGGDEFALVLPGTDLAQAQQLVARLHAAHPFTWSHGLALWNEGTLDQAISEADTLMYSQKRNRK